MCKRTKITCRSNFLTLADKTANRWWSVQVNVLESPIFHIGWEWEARIHERMCLFQVNGVPGWGISEFMYRNMSGRPEEYNEKDPEWTRTINKGWKSLILMRDPWSQNRWIDHSEGVWIRCHNFLMSIQWSIFIWPYSVEEEEETRKKEKKRKEKENAHDGILVLYSFSSNFCFDGWVSRNARPKRTGGVMETMWCPPE